MNLFSSMQQNPNQKGQVSTIFTLSALIGKAKHLTISQLDGNGLQSPPIYAVKVSSSSVEVSRLSPPNGRPFNEPNQTPMYALQQQQMVYPAAPPYPVPGISFPDVHMPVPTQPPPRSRSPSKTSSLLSSLSNRAESYLNKSSSASSMLSSLSGMGDQGSIAPAANTTTPVATITFHSLSSKIDVSLHPAQRTFTITRSDSFSSAHHFEMLLPAPFSDPRQQYSQQQLTRVKWKKEEDMLSGSTTGFRLDTVDSRQTIARYHKKFKSRDGKLSAIEIFLSNEQLKNLEVLDTAVVTAVAMAKYRADSDKVEKEVANEVVSALVGA